MQWSHFPACKRALSPQNSRKSLNEIWYARVLLWGSVKCLWGIVDYLWGSVKYLWGSVNYLWGSANCLWGSVNCLWGSVNYLWGSVNYLWRSVNYLSHVLHGSLLSSWSLDILKWTFVLIHAHVQIENMQYSIWENLAAYDWILLHMIFVSCNKIICPDFCIRSRTQHIVVCAPDVWQCILKCFQVPFSLTPLFRHTLCDFCFGFLV